MGHKDHSLTPLSRSAQERPTSGAWSPSSIQPTGVDQPSSLEHLGDAGVTFSMSTQQRLAAGFDDRRERGTGFSDQSVPRVPALGGNASDQAGVRWLAAVADDSRVHGGCVTETVMSSGGTSRSQNAYTGQSRPEGEITTEELLGWHRTDLINENLRASTIQQRMYVMGRLLRFVYPKSLLQVEPMDLSLFLGRTLAPNSRAVETTHLRQFYAWAVDNDLLDESPARKLKRPRVPTGMPNPMSEADLAMAIEMAPKRVKPWLLLGAFAGLRAGEIAQLKVDDIWWDHVPPTIYIADGKGGAAGTAPLCDELAMWLRQCDLPQSGWLCPRQDGRDGHIAGYLVSQLSNQFLHSLGISHTLHKMRHRFGTEILRASGGNMRTAQIALRHKSIRSTEIYTLIAPQAVQDAANLMPRLGLPLTVHRQEDVA